MHRPRVSIIIPTYNRAAFLKEALESVSAQTHPNWECIVVDDGSTDETESVVAQFEPRVQYVHQENAGPAAARNHGIGVSDGEQILFLDSDDRLLPDALERLHAALDAEPSASVAYGGFYISLPGGEFVSQVRKGTPVLPRPVDLPEGVDPDAVPYGLSKEGNLLPEFLQNDVLLMGTALFRRSCVEAIGGFKESLPHHEHWDFALRVAKSGADFVPTRHPVLCLRMHGNNRGRDPREMLRSRIEQLEAHLPSEDDAERLRAICYGDAYLKCGTALAHQNQLSSALSHLHRALAGARLPLTTYLDCLNAVSRKIGDAALATDDPLGSVSEWLDPFTDSSDQQAVRHFFLGRFRRLLMGRAVRSVALSRAGTWRALGTAAIHGAHACFHHTVAGAHHWGLSGLSFRRGKGWFLPQ